MRALNRSAHCGLGSILNWTGPTPFTGLGDARQVPAQPYPLPAILAYFIVTLSQKSSKQISMVYLEKRYTHKTLQDNTSVTIMGSVAWSGDSSIDVTPLFPIPTQS